MPRLIEKQKYFCEEYLIVLNSTQAALRETAEQMGYTLAQKGSVLE